MYYKPKLLVLLQTRRHKEAHGQDTKPTRVRKTNKLKPRMFNMKLLTNCSNS